MSNLIPDKIEIPVERYDELLEAERWLNALRAAGVDNWQGYDCAIDLLEEEENGEES